MFSKNLKYYRLQKNMTKKELAVLCNVTPMAITNYENGDRMPSIELISKMAKALGIYVSDFLETRNNNLTFVHNSFRKNSKLSTANQDLVRESVEEYFSRFFDTVELLGGNPLPKNIECHTLQLSNDYQENATALRNYLGLSSQGPIESLITTLENLGILILEIDINNDDFFGMNGTVNNYPYIVINSKMRAERKRTTIIHELAHLIFNWDNTSLNEEEMATAIAGAFLISNSDLIRELGTKRTTISKDLNMVCNEYGISMFMLIKRANQANIISEPLAKNFYINANKKNLKDNEPNRVSKQEEPTLFKQLVCRAVNEEGISIQKGSELLKTSINELTNYCGPMEV